MSEFDFMQENGENNDTGASEFSFGDSNEAGGSSEFSFGAEEQAAPKAPVKKAPVKKTKAPMKRTGPRVIGHLGKKAGKGGKINKFAKKGTETDKPKHSAKLTPGVVPPLEELEHPIGAHFVEKNAQPTANESAPTQVEESSAFDFGAAENEEASAFDFGAAENDDTSAFDFGAAGNDETSAFDFGAADNNEASAFDFGAAESNETSAFDFGAAESNETSAFDFGAAQPEAPVQAPQPVMVPNNDVSKEVLELGDVYGNFAHSINTIADAVKDMYSQSEKCKIDIEEAEQKQQEALETEEFDKAEQLDRKITELKGQIIENETNFSYALQEVFENTGEAPNHLTSRSEKAKNQLPGLVETQSTLSKKLEEEEEKQNNDNTTIEIERQKNAQQIEDLQLPIDQHAASIEEMQKEYDTNVENAAGPFDEKISSLEAEKKEVNDKIAELMKQIEELRSQDKSIQANINKENKNKKAAIGAFQADSKKITEEKRKLESEKKKVALEIRKIEAPFQSLLDDVDKRGKQIATLKEQLETTKRLVSEAESDIEQSEKAIEIITELCNNHAQYQESRSLLADKVENSRTIVTNSTARVEFLAAQLVTLNTKLAEAMEVVSSATSRENQLQEQKSAAISSKNFKAAKACADQLKELKESTEKAEKSIIQSNEGIKSNEEETESLKVSIKENENTVEEESINLRKIDYEFYEQAIQSLDNLFQTSPFGEKLLHGLKEMLVVMLEHTEQPKQLTKEEIEAMIEELNAKIEEAVGKDDFDTAETLQNKVDSLTEKLQKFE